MLIVHTADVHIGVENYGRPDPLTKTSSRLQDFLNTLDEVVDYSISNQADIILFCGDAYKSRNPNQTHQREFAARISRLATNGIQVFLLAGNHDAPNIPGPATALDIFPTLGVGNVHTGDTLKTHLVETRSGPLQIVSVPWIRKGQFMSSLGIGENDPSKLNETIETLLTQAIQANAESLDPSIPAVLSGHLSVDSAKTSSEISMMLGKDYVLLKSSIALPQFDYVALGHIHRHQELNVSPRVVYPGSLQRIDFGEEKDTKGFYVIDIDPTESPGKRERSYKFVEVNARKFLTIRSTISDSDPNPTQTVINEITHYDVQEAIVQVLIDTPASKYQDIDEKLIRYSLEESHFVATIRKNLISESRNRLGKNLSEKIEPLEALETYLSERGVIGEKRERLLNKGKLLISEHPQSNTL